MRTLKIIALFVFILGSPVGLWIAARNMPQLERIEPPTAVEIIATVFGAVTIVLGVLALIIAGLAIWGYAAIKEEANKAGREAALKSAEEYFKGKAFDDKIKENLTSGRPEPDGEHGAVAKDYPPEGGLS